MGNHQPNQPEPKRVTENVIQPQSETAVSLCFGVPLTELCERQQSLLPLPIESAIGWLNEQGLKEEGLYRVPGNKSVVDEYIRRYNKGEVVDLSNDFCAENKTSLVIHYIKHLPHSILTNERKGDFKAILDPLDLAEPLSDEVRTNLRTLLGNLPPCHRELIHFLGRHFALVLQNSEYNKMDTRVLGITLKIVFGPTNAKLMHLIAHDPTLCPTRVVFGAPLDSWIPQDENASLVPPVLVTCFEFIENGRYTDDVYLTSCNVKELKQWVYKIDCQGSVEFPVDFDVDVVAALVREFIFACHGTNNLFAPCLQEIYEFLEPLGSDNLKSDETIATAKQYFARLAPVNQAILLRLSEHLQRVIAHSGGRIDVYNLSRTFGIYYTQLFKFFIPYSPLLV